MLPLRIQRAVRRAFTLIELLIVIAILLAIGGLVAVNVMSAKDQADVDLATIQIDSFNAAIKRFRLDLNRYPTEGEGLAVLWSQDAIEDEEEAVNWKGPYLDDPKPTDDWGNDWIYRFPSEIRDSETMYDIVSIGPDGEEDTDDDITNHDRFRDAEGDISEEFEDFGSDADSGAGG